MLESRFVSCFLKNFVDFTILNTYNMRPIAMAKAKAKPKAKSKSKAKPKAKSKKK